MWRIHARRLIFSAFSGLLDIAKNPLGQLQLGEMHKKAAHLGTGKLSSHLHPGPPNIKGGTCYACIAPLSLSSTIIN